MPDNQFLAKPRRGRQIAIATTVLIAVVAVTVAITIWVSQPSKAPQAGPSPTDTPRSNDTGTPDTDIPDALTVISGDKLIDGVSVGYPQNLIGAVSASVEYVSQVGSTLDPDRAEEIGMIVVDPEAGYDQQDFRKGPVTTRKEMELPTSGKVPSGAGCALAPVGYQTRGISDSQVNVLLLGYATLTYPNGTTDTRVGVYPVVMSWKEGDWKMSPMDTSIDYSSLAAPLGTDEATAAGWRTLTR